MRTRKLVSWPIWSWFLVFSLFGPAPAAFGAELRFEPRQGEPPAVALTASDGAGLKLLTLRARAVVEDPLAFTELHLVFQNPEARTLEGRFELRLPPDASLSRLAMKVGSVWQEGEVVERQRARRAFEDFLHRKQDPALLEQGAGNVFTARVFPIGPREKKEIVISYSQTLTARASPLVPLSGLPELDELDAAVYLGGGAAPYRVRTTKQKPGGDLVYARAGGADLPAIRHGDLAVLSLRAPVDDRVDELAGVLVLVDTSASGALELERRIDVARQLAASMSSARLAVVAFDQTTEVMFDGAASGAGADVWSRLAQRGALGATHLEQALVRAGELARSRGLSRLVLVGDGVATAGPTGAHELGRAASALRAGGVERIDVVAGAGLRDQAVLEALARAALARAGVVVDAEAPAAEIVRRLRQRAHGEIRVELPGATWYTPRAVRGLSSGDEFHVFARLPADRPLRVRVGSEALRVVAARSAPRPLVERAWAKAKIDSLLLGPPRAEVLRQIVELSTRHRVLSPFTALLVLESGADYRRYQLDRRALADVLTVAEGRLTVVQRAAPRKTGGGGAIRPAEPASGAGPWDSLWGSEIGVGRERKEAPSTGVGPAIGQGAGHGRMAGSHRTRAPQIRMGATQVSGRLPPETIQRVVRQNFGRFRVCYERGLSRKPALSGRVLVRFMIARDGGVRRVSDGGSTLGDAGVVRCVLEAFTHLTFPAPPSDPVYVAYPLAFSPEGTAQRPAAAKPVEPPVVVDEAEWPRAAGPHTGRFGDVMDKLARNERGAALREAEAWRREAPGDVMAVLALGEALEAASDRARAARAYGSLIDLFPTRADLRRYAGARLERVGGRSSLALARDTFEKALADRPDHATGHRLTAYAWLRERQPRRAFEVLVRALERTDFRARPGVTRVLEEDLTIVAAAWLKLDPRQKRHVSLRLRSFGLALPTGPSVRFVLSWETDASDVDLHVYDGRGGHAYYGRTRLPGGGELGADVQNGYGPESFTIPGRPRTGTYTLQAHYYARGPMGFGMGKLQIVAHDGEGGVELEDRPFVVMTDRAFVDLGVYQPESDVSPGSSAGAAR